MFIGYQQFPRLDLEDNRQPLNDINRGGGLALFDGADAIGRRARHLRELTLAELAPCAVKPDIQAKHGSQVSSVGGRALQEDCSQAKLMRILSRLGRCQQVTLIGKAHS